MVEDSRTGDEAEATAGEKELDAGEDRPDEPPADREDADALAEEAEAFIDDEAGDSAFEFDDETVDDGDDETVDATASETDGVTHTDAGDATASDDAGDVTGDPSDVTTDANDDTADASAGGRSAGSRGSRDRGKSKAELDRELESMDVGAGETERQAEPDAGRERATDSTAAAGPVTEPPSAGDEQTDPAIAGLLSFFVPGLGNVYNGQTGRGLVGMAIWAAWLLIGWGVGGFVFAILLGVLTGGILFLLTGFVLVVVEFLAHLVAAYDAYNQAEKINAGQVDV